MSQRGFYNDDKEWTRKIKEFFKESGFYLLVVIGLCVLAVGAVYFTTNHLITSPEQYDDDLVPNETSLDNENEDENYALADDETKDVDKSAIEQLQNPEKRFHYETGLNTTPETDSETDGNLVTGSNDNTEDRQQTALNEVETIAKPTIMPTVAPTHAPLKPQEPENENRSEQSGDSQEVINLFGKKPTFILPVEGKIITDYAMDRLLYSKTLDEWRTHSGIDIEAPRGEAVKAVADGYIKEIKEDPCYGITIVIDHENGYKSIYSNLASANMVSVNQKVKAGDVISSVGNTAIFEIADPPHLHFEMYKDDKLIDPKTVLPFSGN
ncbi:peptidase M23 [Thermoclostridium stercorarium subsp. thermolacticum DSM 2910]|uniref:Peptidase M23 n=2 Tax=Thermoclostridium stercorarium TaxID=1510 RepID=A0A1B1YHB1_THEST|nr:M23 family metallopeptidase [Thermoclostridium stercorarium]ANW97600.1 peptidase M23 [Thermoclostridium stercorarium subsp. thermolacticum DSM 2910]ANX00160.1 peptidase M23 [Thermoclostridium stercorarium subsp. leptospartum DSM 9219]